MTDLELEAQEELRKLKELKELRELVAKGAVMLLKGELLHQLAVIGWVHQKWIALGRTPSWVKTQELLGLELRRLTRDKPGTPAALAELAGRALLECLLVRDIRTAAIKRLRELALRANLGSLSTEDAAELVDEVWASHPALAGR